MPELYLALYLDGPMQAWGCQSRYSRRTSYGMPTRSGIIGLLCAACGIAADDSEMLLKLEEARLECIAFDFPQRWTDYHTIGGGYDTKTQRHFIGRKADGKTGDTVLSEREYLCEARFGAVLSAGEELAGQLACGLQNPRWGIWLGRKSCIPASPVYRGLFASFEQAQEALLTAERQRCELCGTAQTDVVIVRRIKEVIAFADGSDTLNDRPVNFSKRQFSPRRVLVEDS